MLTVIIKPTMQTKLEQVADMTGQPIDEIVDQALNQHLERLNDQQLEAEIRAFEQMYADLKENYFGQFVAVYQGQVVDADADIEPLFLRIQDSFGDRTVLIRQVGDTPDETYRFHGVRLEPIL